MLRGQTAPLSPKEEVTLRRIALGMAPLDELSPHAVRRLTALALAKRDGERFVLTPLGAARYETLPRATRSEAFERVRWEQAMISYMAIAQRKGAFEFLLLPPPTQKKKARAIVPKDEVVG